MATDLRDRLTHLAGHTPPGAPPPDLWTRGVRRRRVGQAETALLVAVLVLLVGVGGWNINRTQRDIDPVDNQGSVHLPDRFFTPSPWLPTFDGPPGRLVAVGVAEHESLLHSSTGAYGVTASGGEYGFLDLPGLADRLDDPSAVPPALSPDGQRIAYWVTGTPSGKPNTMLYGQTITGVAVYDATTGQVRMARLATEHGLAPETLVWSDSRTVVMGVGQAMSGDDNEQLLSSAHGFRLIGWRLADSAPKPLDVPKGVHAYDELTAGHDVIIVAGNERTAWLIWPDHPGRDRRIRVPDGNAVTVASPGATKVASVEGNRNPNRLLVGSVRRGVARTRLEQVNNGRQYYEPIAWTDDRHVAAVVRNPYRHTTEMLTARLDLVDVQTGSSRTLVDHLAGGGIGWHGLSFAMDLLTAPSAHATPPPAPWDQRVVAIGLIVVLSIVGGLLLLTWGVRRAARP